MAGVSRKGSSRNERFNAFMVSASQMSLAERYGVSIGFALPYAQSGSGPEWKVYVFPSWPRVGALSKVPVAFGRAIENWLASRARGDGADGWQDACTSHQICPTSPAPGFHVTALMRFHATSFVHVVRASIGNIGSRTWNAMPYLLMLASTLFVGCNVAALL
jgi:hypothetical protein